MVQVKLRAVSIVRWSIWLEREERKLESGITSESFRRKSCIFKRLSVQSFTGDYKSVKGMMLQIRVGHLWAL